MIDCGNFPEVRSQQRVEQTDLIAQNFYEGNRLSNGGNKLRIKLQSGPKEKAILFLSHASILAHDIYMGFLSARLSVCLTN